MINNTKYHCQQATESKFPITAWNKTQIQEWLDKKEFKYDGKTQCHAFAKAARKYYIKKV